MAVGWTDWHERSSRHYSEPRNHCLAPGGSEYGRYLWVRSHIAPGDRVLDIGCNCGQLAENLTRDLGCEVVGVDVIQEFVDYCNANKPGTFVCGDFGAMESGRLHALSGDDGHVHRFDVITALEVIEHDIDVRMLIVKAWYMLKPGGKLIVTTPHPDGITGYAIQGQEGAHVRVWTRWRLEAAFSIAFDCPIDYTEIMRDECGRLLSMGVVWKKDDWPEGDTWAQQLRRKGIPL
jgi:2-polyprenyl-3-methyl-5-hydroxy-6-metoxy-1,4-benzoquinol methylase